MFYLFIIVRHCVIFFKAISWVKPRFPLASLTEKYRNFSVAIAAAHKAVLVVISWCFGDEIRHFVQSLSNIISTRSSPFRFAVTNVAYQLNNKIVPVMYMSFFRQIILFISKMNSSGTPLSIRKIAFCNILKFF